jgi:hypothetical protein
MGISPDNHTDEQRTLIAQNDMVSLRAQAPLE